MSGALSRAAGGGACRWAGAASAAAIAASRLGALGPPPMPPACELRHSGRPHSRARARAVVAGHYDLPVSFFRLILDPSMAYSCGYWAIDDAEYGLADAQRDKFDLVCRKLELGPGEPPARHGMRLGIAHGTRRAALQGAGHRGHAVS